MMRSYQVLDLDKIKIINNLFFSFRSFDLISERTDDKFFDCTSFIAMHFSCSFSGLICQFCRDSYTKLFFALVLFFSHLVTPVNFVFIYLSFYIYKFLERFLENYLYSVFTHTIKKTRKLAKGCKMKNLCVCHQRSKRDPMKKPETFFLLKISNINFIYNNILEIISFNQFINFNLFSINQLMTIFSGIFTCKKSQNLDAKITNLDAKFTIFVHKLPQLRRQDHKLRRQVFAGCDPHV